MRWIFTWKPILIAGAASLVLSFAGVPGTYRWPLYVIAIVVGGFVEGAREERARDAA